MDKPLKERIVGAIVLVVVAVLLVPVFLDGTADESGEIHEAISLPGQDESSPRQKTVILDRDRENPIPQARDVAVAEKPVPDDTASPTVKEAPPPTADSTATKVVTAEPPPTAPKPGAAAADKTSSTGMWAVQLGSFSSKDNAERLAASLRKEGYSAFLSQLDSAGKSLHRVRVGPQKDRAGAEEVAAKLAKAGHKGQVVPHP